MTSQDQHSGAPAPALNALYMLSETAAQLDGEADQLEARAAAVADQHNDPQSGTFHTANNLQTALFTAAKNARRTADTFRTAALYAEALAQMEAAPVCPAEFAIFDAATLDKAEGLYMWRGADPIPSQGARVQVKMNGLGPGKVAGYFLAGEAGKADPEHPERRFLGVAVMLETPPDWYKQQAPDWQSAPARVFGPEVAPLE